MFLFEPIFFVKFIPTKIGTYKTNLILKKVVNKVVNKTFTIFCHIISTQYLFHHNL